MNTWWKRIECGTRFRDKRGNWDPNPIMRFPLHHRLWWWWYDEVRSRLPFWFFDPIPEPSTVVLRKRRCTK